MSHSLFHNLGVFASRYRWPIIALWTVVLGLSIMCIPGADSIPPPDSLSTLPALSQPPPSPPAADPTPVACGGAVGLSVAALPAAPPALSQDPEVAGPLGRIDALMARGIAAGAFPGAVVLIADEGVVLKHSAYGNALQDGPRSQPPVEPIPTREDTIFDLASVTKMFTAVAVMQLVECGRVELDAPVQRYLPDFAGPGKERVAVRHLLTHTGGLPPGPQGPYPLSLAGATRAERLRHVVQTPLRGEPGAGVVYSDAGFIVLGALIERVSGQRQDEYTAQHILGPLGMSDTGYRPSAALKDRIAATEILLTSSSQSRQGLIYGEVHDDNAWLLDGVAGHAGLFSTAADLACFAQMIVDGGAYGGVRVLRAETLAAMTRINATSSNDEHRGLGFEIDQPWFMGALAGPRSVGHTSFTGTSLAINLDRHAFAILLPNRLHPADRQDNLRAYRSGVGDLAAAAEPAGTHRLHSTGAP